MIIRPTELWEKVKLFDLDENAGSYSFSVRLAAENKWTKSFTDQVILEYKKFMFLAAVSNQMVSPAELVDIVWHQHLIFTKSYSDFCSLLGKDIQHIPSTHHHQEDQSFRMAMEHTGRLYNDHFGEQPESIWKRAEMLESLNLQPAKRDLNFLLMLGLGAILLVTIPFYFLLSPVISLIPNPYFLLGYFLLIAILWFVFEVYNHRYIKRLVRGFDKHSFAFQLTPFELIYLKNGSVMGAVNATINELLKNESVTLSPNGQLKLTDTVTTTTPEQEEATSLLTILQRSAYEVFAMKLSLTPIFKNTVRSMNQFKSTILNSIRFRRLIHLNFIVCASLFLFGFTRILTGISNHKPIGFLVITLILFTIGSIFFLKRLLQYPHKIIIPQWYEKNYLNLEEVKSDSHWQYFAAGNTALLASFAILALRSEDDYTGGRGGGGYGSGGTCGTGTGTNCGSGGGSCGGGCGGCGGCGGGD